MVEPERSPPFLWMSYASYNVQFHLSFHRVGSDCSSMRTWKTAAQNTNWPYLLRAQWDKNTAFANKVLARAATALRMKAILPQRAGVWLASSLISSMAQKPFSPQREKFHIRGQLFANIQWYRARREIRSWQQGTNRKLAAMQSCD